MQIYAKVLPHTENSPGLLVVCGAEDEHMASKEGY